MKTNCIGVAELLCAYADGELEKSKVHIVEDHLLICENCSAILKLYGEISTAIYDTNVPAPEALRPGVMNRIQHEEIHTEIEKIKKRKQYHFILTRFAPVAACLVVGILIWQTWGNYLDYSGDSAVPPAQMADSEFYRLSLDVAPTSEPAPAPEAAPGDMESVADSDPDGEPAAGGNIINDDASDSFGTFRVLLPQDVEHYQEHIDGAYAEINITGELPALLESYMPQAFGPWPPWDIVFEIPSTDIAALLDELGSNEELVVNRNIQNASSPYVMVFFSFEE